MAVVVLRTSSTAKESAVVGFGVGGTLQMRSVYLWACPCGTRHKAVCEHDPATKSPVSIVSCKDCRRTMQLDGTVLQLFIETLDGNWVPAAASRETA